MDKIAKNITHAAEKIARDAQATANKVRRKTDVCRTIMDHRATCTPGYSCMNQAYAFLD